MGNFLLILPDLSKMRKTKEILVSVDNNSGWPDALFLPNPTAEKVIEVSSHNFKVRGIPKRTDPGTVFWSKKNKQFCGERFMKLVMCPVRDHCGNKKVGRMIRTINGTLRTNAKIVIKKNKNGISDILSALRTERGANGKSAFEKQTGRNQIP